MKKVLMIQQVAHEGVGRFGDALVECGIDAQVVRVFEGQDLPRELPEDAGLIVLGGPMGASDEGEYPFLKDELLLIESALDKQASVLGICLGAQLLARAAGARVYNGGAKEIGWYPLYTNEEGRKDKLFNGLPSAVNVFQWHGDTFDVPTGGVNLASSELFPNQLIRVGERAYGLQFHLEVTAEMISLWLDENKEEVYGLKGIIDPGKILAETKAAMPDLEKIGQSVFPRFLTV